MDNRFTTFGKRRKKKKKKNQDYFKRMREILEPNLGISIKTCLSYFLASISLPPKIKRPCFAAALAIARDHS